MKIQCILLRSGGTKTDIDGIQYHFEPLADGAHVADVVIDAHADRFLSIAEGYKLYRGNCSPIGEAVKIADFLAAPIVNEAPKRGGMLAGSDQHAAQYEINGNIYSLSDVVRKSFEASGLSEDEWNALDEDDRAAKIDIMLDDIADAPMPNAPTAKDADEAVANDNKALQEEDRAALVDAYVAKFSKKPHGKWTAEKIKSELDA